MTNYVFNYILVLAITAPIALRYRLLYTLDDCPIVDTIVPVQCPHDGPAYHSPHSLVPQKLILILALYILSHITVDICINTLDACVYICVCVCVSVCIHHR